jgi:3-isopropylmalate/(R)-2-methylmalate dehydratase large subunit
MAVGMATGLAWFKVPEAIKVTLKGKLGRHVSGKDVILHLIGELGVDGARYSSLEFTGDIGNLTMDDRFTIANMAIEAGAKNGIFPVDEKTLAYIAAHGGNTGVTYTADADAVYAREVVIELGKVPPTVAFPHLPENTKTIDQVGDIKIDQVIIGSCTNGRLEDLRAAAEVFKGRKVAGGVRAIIIPATQLIYRQAMDEGLFSIFLDAGCAISTPTCGPCLGGHMGILAEGERCVATTNRNFVGRMGHTRSEVYLASPVVAAASAITGKISAPDQL